MLGIGIRIGWLFIKLLCLYTGALLFSISLYFYLHRTLLPPHRTLQFPMNWQDNEGFVELERGQRLGENFKLKGMTDDMRDDYSLNHDSILSGFTSNFNSNMQSPGMIQMTNNCNNLNVVTYDISLLLKYPDRKEVADLGNLKIDLKLIRRDGSSAGTIKTVQSLRYESKALRGFKELLGLPGAIWNDRGSERLERIPLVQRLLDEYEKDESEKLLKSFGVDDVEMINNKNKNKNNNKNKNKNKDKDNDNFHIKNDHIQNNNVHKHKNGNGNNHRNNPISRLQISISPLPPIHSIQLEIVANLSPLQHFLFYWRFVGAFLIIGGCTAGLWVLINIYGLIELIKLIYNYNSKNEKEIQNEQEGSEFEIIENDEITVTTAEIEPETEAELVDSTNDAISFTSESPALCSTQNSLKVAEFIKELRRRKLQNHKNFQSDLDDENSVYNSELDLELNDDHNVPESTESVSVNTSASVSVNEKEE